MVRNRFVKLLLLPSLSSTILGSLLAAVVIIGANWPLLDNAVFRDYFGGAVTNLQGLTGTTTPVDEAFDSRALTIMAGVLVAAVVVLLLVRGIIGIINSISWTVQEMRAVDGPAKRAVEHELGKRVTVRLLVAIVWAIYIFVSLKIILPFCVLASQLGFSSNRSVEEGVGYVFFALVLLLASMHLHVILGRLLLLRPRIFGGEEALLVG